MWPAGISSAVVSGFFNGPNTSTKQGTTNGSGVAVLIEIARVLATHPTERSILIVFSTTDGHTHTIYSGFRKAFE